MMFSLLLAAALTAASPAPTAPAPKLTETQKLQNLAKDAPLVCAAQFEEGIRFMSGDRKGQKPKVIDIYAKKTGIPADAKTLLTSYCGMFNLGAAYLIMQMNAAAQANRPRSMDSPGKHVASFTY